ncbi:MAG: dephospho-CoA kinase [Pirellulaceae bacterium]
MTSSDSLQKIFVVGLVGGIASGKSRVAAMFASLGAAVIDADRLGHDILQWPTIVRQLTQRLGPSILNEDGRIDRRQLSKLVFGSEPDSAQRLKQLEEVLHPQIYAEAVRELKRLLASERRPSAIVIDAPLLLEAQWAPMCDLILFIDTPEEVRAVERPSADGALNTSNRVNRSNGRLTPRRAATHIIDGTADETSLRSTITRLLREMHKG